MTTIPAEICLLALHERWEVNLVKFKSKPFISAPPFKIVLGGQGDRAHYLKLLKKWLKLRAEEKLLPKLLKLSHETGLKYVKAAVKHNYSQWGSCSIDKLIYLNLEILFLPPTLARHAMIHELCHLKHFNHSQKFWQLVASFDENWQENRKELKKAQHFIPICFKKVV